MSKKKAFGGNTMTLKDFHGGSIPSNLPLPSAPGVTGRPSEHSGYDRPASWGNPTGRSRLNSSTTTMHFDDKTHFLTPVGRNFDEDERKPLDGVSTPRRTISDDSIQASAGHLELKPQQFLAGRPLGQQGPVQVSTLPSQMSYLGRVSGCPQGSVGSQNVYGNSGPWTPGLIPNVWASRKEPVDIIESAHPTLSASAAASKLIHASALEKVSSGRWQSKQSIPFMADVEVIQHVEETGLSSKGYDNAKYNRIDTVSGRGYVDIALPRQIERNLTIDEGVHGARREISDGEMGEEPPFYSDEKERTAVIYDEAIQPVHAEGRIVRSEFHGPMTAEMSERLKLRLLPRTKPLEKPEQPFVEHKQVFQRAESGHSESTITPGVESGSQPVERLKLNLKPRSQPLEQSEGFADRDRSSVFGGARPRELVLKERGIDDVNINNYDLGQGSERSKQASTKTEWAPGTVTSSCYSEKSDKLADQKNSGKFDRKDQQAEDRGDPQRNWRSENRKNTRDNPDRQQTHQRHQHEHQPSPEIWRKPVEDPKPLSPEPVVRFRKAASAAELAQAFSCSYSNPKAPIQLTAVPGQSQAQMPFSRLTGQLP